MRLRTKKSLKNQAYRDLYAVSDIVFTTAKVASLNVMIFISLLCGPNNMKFRYSIHLHCSQVILQTMNAVYWLYTTITKHSKKVDCQSKLLQNENQPEFQPTDVTFEPPQENLCFLRGCLFTFIKVGVSNILQIQCITTIMSQQMDV